tara:strand:+ start:655 stop:861 length:207 start_codon:yes stop_codon:yes gene_type:complete
VISELTGVGQNQTRKMTMSDIFFNFSYAPISTTLIWVCIAAIVLILKWKHSEGHFDLNRVNDEEYEND